MLNHWVTVGDGTAAAVVVLMRNLPAVLTQIPLVTDGVGMVQPVAEYDVWYKLKR